MYRCLYDREAVVDALSAQALENLDLRQRIRELEAELKSVKEELERVKPVSVEL